MKSSYTFPFIVFFVLLTFFLVSCGSTNATSSSGSSRSSAVPMATTDTNTSSRKDYPTYGKNYSTPTTTTQNTTAIKIAAAPVNGKNATILTNAQGMTLYYFTPGTSANTRYSYALSPLSHLKTKIEDGKIYVEIPQKG